MKYFLAWRDARLRRMSVKRKLIETLLLLVIIPILTFILKWEAVKCIQLINKLCN